MDVVRRAPRTGDFSLEELFGSRGWLATTSSLLRGRIIDAGRMISLERGDRLFSAGALPGGIFGVISGGVGAEGSSQWHTPRLGHIYRSGHWFGHGPALHGGVRTMGYVATENSTLLAVPLERLRALMRDDPEMIKLVGQMASMGTDLATGIVCDLLIPGAPKRIAAVLLRVTGAGEGIEPTDPAGFELTQADIATLSNSSRIYVSRVLGKFVKAGWIATNYRHIRLIDPEALARFAFSEDDQ